MTIEEAIKNRENCLEYLEKSGPLATKENVQAVRLSLEALREKAEREKNAPLTREKLVELLNEAFEFHIDDPYCRPDANEFADHLIAHGVTVLPVQVGDTVYGRFRSYGKEVHKCEVVKVKACQFKDRTVRYFLDLEFHIIDPFFHDGRLMRCGMQAVYGADFGAWYRVYLTREEAEAQPPKGE